MINSLYACASNNDNNIEDIFLLNEDFSWIQTNLIQEKDILLLKMMKNIVKKKNSF